MPEKRTMETLPAPETSRSSAELFCRYFGALREKGIKAVVLHGYDGFPERFDSDIDFAVSGDNLHPAISILHDVCAESGWLVAQILQHEVFAFYCVAVSADDPRHALKFDVCSDYVRNGKVFIEDSWLLRDARPRKDFLVPATSSEFLYVLTKAIAKGKPLENVKPRLRFLYSEDALGCQSVFRQFFGGSTAECGDLFGPDAPAAALKTALFAGLGRNYPLSLRIREWARRLRRWISPSGMTIGVLGVDGSGKSTLIDNLSRILLPCFRQCETLHFRPGFGSRRDTKVVRNPHANPPRGLVLSWVKLLYYWADWWLGTLFRVRPAECHSTLFFFDRHLMDVLIDPNRYRLRGVSGIARFVVGAVPKPDFLIGLVGDVRTLARRKGEVSESEMDRQQKAIRRVVASAPNGLVIDAAQEESAVAVSAAASVVKLLAARCERRFRLG